MVSKNFKEIKSMKDKFGIFYKHFIYKNTKQIPKY